MSRRHISDWRRAVLASKAPGMTGSVKVLLLYLADHMREGNKHVSVPRDKIAKDLGVHQQRVAERYTKAVKAGFLVSVSPGFTGRTAVYQGTWPDLGITDCVPQTRTHSDTRKAVHSPDFAERESARLCTALQDANTRADLYLPPADRHVGNDAKTAPTRAAGRPPTVMVGEKRSDEEAAPTQAAARPTDCQWHDDQTCPDDCANHRRRSA